MKEQKGFSVIIVLLALLVLGAATTGWYVWQSKNNNKHADNTEQSYTEIPEETPNEVEETRIEPLPGEVDRYDIAKIAKNDKQKQISEAILDYCISLKWEGVDKEHALVAGAKDIFDNMSLFKSTPTNASVSASCYSTDIDVNEQPTGRQYLLHKDEALHRWVVDSAGQMAPSCSSVDGLGYTADILSTCYIDNTNGDSRPPR